jgi:hypothetical protein
MKKGLMTFLFCIFIIPFLINQLYGQITVKDSIEIKAPQKINKIQNKSPMSINSVWESSKYVFQKYWGDITWPYSTSWLWTDEKKFKYTLDGNYFTFDYYEKKTGSADDAYTNICHAVPIDFPVAGGEITVKMFHYEPPLGSTLSRGWKLYVFKDFFDFEEGPYGTPDNMYYARGYGQNLDTYSNFINLSYGFPGITQRLEPPCNKVILVLERQDGVFNYNDFDTNCEINQKNDSTYILKYTTADQMEKIGVKVMVNWKEIMHMYRFEISEDTLHHLDESIIRVHAVDNTLNGNDVYMPDDTKVDFSIGEGYENFGSLINLNGMPTKVIKEVTYGAARNGQIRYKADGDIPLEEQNIHIAVRESENDQTTWGWDIEWGIADICLRPRPNEYRMTIDPDTITHGKSAVIFIREINANGEAVDTPGDTRLIFSLSPEGRKYGSLRLADSTLIEPGREINYSVVHAGGVRYFADGDGVNGPKTIYVTVKDAADDAKTGTSKIVVMDSISLTLNVTEPQEIWPSLPQTGVYTGRNVNENNMKQNILVALQKNGLPFANQAVMVHVKMRLPSGGHDHIIYPPPELMGNLTVINGGNGNGMITAVTNQNGEIRLDYRAPEFGGIFDFTAITVFNRDTIKATDSLIVRVPNLELLPDHVNYDKIGGTCRHHGPTQYNISDDCTTPDHNHWGTREMLDVIRNIAITYDSLHNGVRLAINDISLEYGGLFDSEFGHDWVYVPHVSHVEHRIGKQVDIGHNAYFQEERLE